MPASSSTDTRIALKKLQVSRLKSSHMPQEIIDLFIQEVSQLSNIRTSKKSLVACTTVSHAFSLPARRQLYSEIQVAHFDQKPRTQDGDKQKAWHHVQFKILKQRLEDPSSYGSLIRKIHIDLRESIIPLEDDIELYSIFGGLKLYAPNVECFWMSGTYSMNWWPDMNLEPASTFVDVLVSWTQLTTIRICNIMNFTMDFLPSLPSVSCLELINVQFHISESLEEKKVAQAPQLHGLFIHRSIDGFQAFQNGIKLDLSALRRVQISVFDHKEALFFSTITQKSFRSLQSLDLMLRTNNQFLKGGPINVGQFSDLRKLRLQIQTGTSRIMLSMADIFSLLHPPSSYPTRLESIEILFNSVRGPGWPAQTFLPEDLDEDDAAVWRSISPTHLRRVHTNLRSIHIGLDLMLMEHPRVPRTAESMHEDEALLEKRLTKYIRDSSGHIDAILTVHVVVWEHRTFRKLVH